MKINTEKETTTTIAKNEKKASGNAHERDASIRLEHVLPNDIQQISPRKRR